MEQEYRMIDTGLRGPIQKDILASVMGQLSDGRWQNSPRMEQYWRNADVVEQGGKVYLQIRPHSFPYYAMSDAEILQWFGKKIKILIKEEFGKSREVWNRTNTKQKTDYLSHKYPSQTTVADCYYAYDTLMGRKTSNKVYGTNNNFETAFESLMTDVDKKKVIKESVNKPSRRKVIKEEVYTGYAFREAFEDWKPSNYKQVGNFGYDDNGNPSFGWLDGTVVVSLTEGGQLLVHTPLMVDGNQQEDGFTRQFEIDEIDMAKECIEGLIDELGIADESKKPSRKAIIKQGAMKEIYTKFVEAFAYWVPRNQTSRGDLTEDMEGNPCVAFEDGRVVISLLEFGKKIKVCADQSQDYMRKYFNFDEVEAIKKYTESLIDYIHSDANNLEDQNDEKWAEHQFGMESKKVNTKRKVIKQSIEDWEISKAIQQAVYDFDWKGVEYDDVDVIGEFEYNLCGGNFRDEYQVEKIVTDYLTKHYRDFACQSVKPSKKKKVIKEESEFDNISWSPDAPAPTLDQVIAKLQKAREELGNVEVAVQYRDDGGEYSGYDNNLYFWFDKNTKTFVL